MSNNNNVQDLVISSYDIANADSAVDNWLDHANNHADDGLALAVPVGVLTKKYNDLDSQADTISGLINEIMNGASAELDNFHEIIEAYEASDNYLQDKLDNAEIDITGDITEASGADFSRLSTLETDLKELINERREEASGNINTFHTSISEQISQHTSENSDFVTAVFNGEFGGENVSYDYLTIKEGIDRFDCGGEENVLQSGKAFHAFELTNHCVTIGEDSNDLVFKSLKKGGDGQSKEILRLHQSVVSAMSVEKYHFYYESPVIETQYYELDNDLDGKTDEEKSSILTALRDTIVAFLEFCVTNIEALSDNADENEFVADMVDWTVIGDDMLLNIDSRISQLP